MLNSQKKMSNSFFALLSLPATAMGFGLSVQISALTWILSTKYGLSIDHIGFVWAAGPIAGIIAQPIVGALSDKLWFMGGRRRPWILIGGTLTAIMLLALPNLEIVQKVFASGSGASGLMAIAVVVALMLDLSINVSFNPTRSLIADCTPQKERDKGYTWMQTVSGTFGVLAYLIAVIFGNETLIYIGVVLALLFTFIPMFFIAEPRYLEEESSIKTVKSSNSFVEISKSLLPLYGFLLYGIYVIFAKLFGFEDKSIALQFNSFSLSWVELSCVIIELLAILAVIFNVFKQKENNHEFQKILLAHSFTWWGVQTMFIYAFFYITNNIGLDETVGGRTNSLAFFILSLVSAVLPVLVLKKVAEKISAVRTHTISIVIMCLGYAGIYFIGNTVVLYYALIAIAGIGWASVVSLPFAIISKRVEQSKMGLYMGIFNLSVVLPQLVASFKMGEIVNSAPDKSIIFAICAITLAISGGLWFFVKKDK